VQSDSKPTLHVRCNHPLLFDSKNTKFITSQHVRRYTPCTLTTLCKESSGKVTLLREYSKLAELMVEMARAGIQADGRILKTYGGGDLRGRGAVRERSEAAAEDRGVGPSGE
jgi:hypothetical protein